MYLEKLFLNALYTCYISSVFQDPSVTQQQQMVAVAEIGMKCIIITLQFTAELTSKNKCLIFPDSIYIVLEHATGYYVICNCASA